MSPTGTATTLKTGDGCRLWTERSGRGPLLVCCHGGPGMWDYLGPVADMVSDRRTVWRWDQRGGGRSDRVGPYALARFVADLEELRQHADVDRVGLLGHSWGATLALAYALQHPQRVAELVYMAGTGLGWAWKPAYEQAIAARIEELDEGRAGRVAQLRDTPAEARSLTEERELTVLQLSAEFADRRRAVELAVAMATPWFPTGYACLQALNAELKSRWREAALLPGCRALDVPVLIVHGAQDPRPREAVNSLAEALPDATRVILPGAGHVPWLEAPDATRRSLRNFLIDRRPDAC